jgi:hypothetical protein
MRQTQIPMALLAAVVFAAFGAHAQDIKPRKTSPQAPSATEAPADPARQLYYATTGEGTGKHVGLKVSLYQMSRDCDLSLVPPGRTFESGERLRFGIETNIDGYLYIVQRGSSGRTDLLFPAAKINEGANRLLRGAELMVPGAKWFTFDATPGTERLQFVVSRKPLDIIPHLLAGPGSASQPQGTEGEVLAQMRGKRSRDLVMTPPAKPQAIQAAASTESSVYDPVYAVNSGDGEYCVLTIALNHR